jgi:hypothetical protein
MEVAVAVVVMDVWWVLCRRALQLRCWLRHSCALSIIPTSARVHVNRHIPSTHNVLKTPSHL